MATPTDYNSADRLERFQIGLCGERVEIELAGLSDGPLARIRRQYQQFVTESAGSPDWRIRCRVDDSVAVERGDAEMISDDLGLLSFHHRSSLLLRESGGDGYTLRHSWDDARPLENALRAITSERLLLRGGALFHSAAIEWQGMGWLFPGISGAGKTTLCHKAGRAAVLCDEMPAVLPSDSGWRVYATPFHGDYGPSDRGDSLPLAAVVLLDGKDREAEALAGGAFATQRLISCLVRYGTPTETAIQRTKAMLMGLRESVPVATLASSRDEPFEAIASRLGRLLSGEGEAPQTLRA